MLVDRLRCGGLRVDIGGRVTSPFLRGNGTALILSGGSLRADARLESYNYDDTDLVADGRAVAAADAKKYSGPSSLYGRERVLVIYPGDEPAVTGILTRLLGPRLAGP
jgi:hypothetical protein